MITGMRSWMGLSSSFTSVVMIAKKPFVYPWWLPVLPDAGQSKGLPALHADGLGLLWEALMAFHSKKLSIGTRQRRRL